MGSYPKDIPFRIRLSDGTTKTDPETFTEEDLVDAGYSVVSDPPQILPNQILEWSSSNVEWVVREKTEEEIEFDKYEKWNEVRNIRDSLLSNTDFVVLRSYEMSEAVPEEYLTYRQELRDIPQTQTDPFNIVWPELYPEQS